VDITGEGAMTVHQGPIISQAKRHRYPPVISAHMELTLVELGIAFRKMLSLLYQTSAAKVQVTTEVCRLAGFRDLCVTSFKRLRHESWNCPRFVLNILSTFNGP
jgi:hypothetical protein